MFNRWLLSEEDIKSTRSTVDKQPMHTFSVERKFCKNVVERRIDIVIFLAKRTLTFRGSNKIYGSPLNGDFLNLFEQLMKRNPVLNELKKE